MRPNIELRAEELPEQQAWDDARTNASKLFGYTMPRTYLTGANVADFATQVRAKANESISDLGYLIDELDTAHRRLGPGAGGQRSACRRARAAGLRRQALQHLRQRRGDRRDGERRIAGRAGDRRSDPQRRRPGHRAHCATSSGNSWRSSREGTEASRRVPATVPARSGSACSEAISIPAARSATN